MPVPDTAPAPTDGNAAPAAPVADQQVPAPAETSTAETKELEVVYDGAPINASNTSEETTAEPTEAKPATAELGEGEGGEAEGDDQPRKGRDAQSRIRELNDKNKSLEVELAETKAAMTDVLARKYPEYDVDKAIADGKDPRDARLEAVEHDRVNEKLVSSVASLNETILTDSHKTAEEFPFMDIDNPDRTPAQIALAQEITDGWFNDAEVKFEQDESTGAEYFTSAKEGLYAYTKRIMRIAELHSAGAAASAKVEGQRNAEHQLAAVEIPAGRAPAADPKEDAKLSPKEYAAKHKLEVVGG